MTATQTHSKKMPGQLRRRGRHIRYGIARLALLAILLSSGLANGADRWTAGVWPSDYRADDTNATAIIQTNLYALQRTEIYSLTAASSNGVSTNIPRYYDGKANVGPFSTAPYGWTNIYYYRINDIGVTNYTPTSSNAVLVYTSGVYVVSNAASYSTTSGVYSFRANHIDLRTLDVQHNYNRRYEIYAPTQTAYIADNWPFTLSTNFHFNEYSQATNLNLYKSERANLVYIKSQLKDTFGKYVDMSKADTNGYYEPYLRSATNWQWTYVQAWPPTSTNDASYYMWVQTTPSNMPFVSIESLVKANSNFPHTVTTNIFTNDAPGWMYGELFDQTVSQPYTTLTYSSSWFDWTPYRAIGGYSSNDVYGHVVSNQWTFDPWGMSTTNATTNYLWTASSNSTDWRVIYSANYDTNGSKTQACASVEFKTSEQFSGCVYSPTNFLTYGVLVTNSWIDANADVNDYGWKWVPFVFSNMQHMAIDDYPYSVTQYTRVDVSLDCGGSGEDPCFGDYSGYTYKTNSLRDYYWEFYDGLVQPVTDNLFCGYAYVLKDGGAYDGFISTAIADKILTIAPVISESQTALQLDYYVGTHFYRSIFELMQAGKYGPINATNYFGLDVLGVGERYVISTHEEMFIAQKNSTTDPGLYDWLLVCDIPTNISNSAWDYTLSCLDFQSLAGTVYSSLGDYVSGYYIVNLEMDGITCVIKLDQ